MKIRNRPLRMKAKVSRKRETAMVGTKAKRHRNRNGRESEKQILNTRTQFLSLFFHNFSSARSALRCRSKIKPFRCDAVKCHSFLCCCKIGSFVVAKPSLSLCCCKIRSFVVAKPSLSWCVAVNATTFVCCSNNYTMVLRLRAFHIWAITIRWF